MKTAIESNDAVIRFQDNGSMIAGTVQSVNRGIATVEWDNGQESFETDLYKVGDRIHCVHIGWLGFGTIENIGDFGLEIRWPGNDEADFYSFREIGLGGWTLEAA